MRTVCAKWDVLRSEREGNSRRNFKTPLKKKKNPTTKPLFCHQKIHGLDDAPKRGSSFRKNIAPKLERVVELLK